MPRADDKISAGDCLFHAMQLSIRSPLRLHEFVYSEDSSDSWAVFASLVLFSRRAGSRAHDDVIFF